MKIVIVLDQSLPVGLLANAAAVLAFSASKYVPDGVGHDVADAEGGIHLGITQIPIPILACEGERLVELRKQAAAAEGVTCIDFCDVAQCAKRYDEYATTLKHHKGSELKYLGLCMYGEPAPVKRLTGHFSLVK